MTPFDPKRTVIVAAALLSLAKIARSKQMQNSKLSRAEAVIQQLLQSRKAKSI
ncbi:MULTISPECIES: hypothetical protein [unclassified Halomonas]|uniref:hypothetical protein n=1 Tax=unclassified Halomonas TaxID=2609666 RepID=UPI00131DFAA7|nr:MULTISPECIES: hypothetical protein [unclassified Halomonas]